MARAARRLADNAPGPLFVDDSCIDCDLCRQLAPSVFARAQGQSIVARQPADDAERLRAAMAVVSCPTASIGGVAKQDVAAAIAGLPEPLGGGVYFCGYASPRSYGASSYLLRRSAGNVLVDSPRAAEPLLRRIEALGGVRLLFLTHRDDVADHDELAQRLGCERVIHAADVTVPTRGVERRVEGDAPVRLADDLLAIPVPGHTRGSQALLWNGSLFTGDHLWGSDQGDALEASRSVCWWSWEAQLRSIERLLDYAFARVLPGHGRRYETVDAATMKVKIRALLDRLA